MTNTDKDIKKLIEIITRALPFLEHRMQESPQPDLVKAVTDIREFIATHKQGK